MSWFARWSTRTGVMPSATPCCNERDTGLRSNMNEGDRIFVAGHGGLVGSAIVRRLHAAGIRNLLLATRADLNLCNQAAVDRFFSVEKPDYVFLAAARVGGI